MRCCSQLHPVVMAVSGTLGQCGTCRQPCGQSRLVFQFKGLACLGFSLGWMLVKVGQHGGMQGALSGLFAATLAKTPRLGRQAERGYSDAQKPLQHEQCAKQQDDKQCQ